MKLKKIDWATFKLRATMFLIGASAMAAVLGTVAFFKTYKLVFQSPILIKKRFVTPGPVERREIDNDNEDKNSTEASPEPTRAVLRQTWQGIASWYSRDGCIGCSDSLHMANGEPLDDSRKTLAFNELPLGTRVRVRNMANNMITEAIVTDRHGADNVKYGYRIADLTVATKEAIACTDLCEVKITVVKK